eukprot:TRINITY_DN76403_c0_g1_i1.p1 TRINITY_DN76403_c0_g1~~TRINITY_DN76403_c0_g1_i1.p1  ORF type:complete len:141 (+),score=24.23 TRINITY_DN76403_c0_g1_i1:259-681(+)
MPPLGMTSSTTHWRPGESSLARHSFNAIVSQKKFDVPESLMWQVSMGSQATFGSRWEPSGVKARRTSAAMQTRPDLAPKPQPGQFASLPRRLDNDFMASRYHTPREPEREMLVNNGGYLCWQQPLRQQRSEPNLMRRTFQ